MPTTARKARKRRRQAALAIASNPRLSNGRRALAAAEAEELRFQHPTKGPSTRRVPGLSAMDERRLYRRIRRFFGRG